MSTIKIKYYKSPVGELLVGSYNDELCLCDWRYRKMRKEIDKRIQVGLDAEFIEGESPIINETILQLVQYFNEDRTEFDLPIKFVGTDFQISVWNGLLKIPFGKTETYLGLSKKLGNEKAIRAVSSANGANAISIIVPCHRIIGSNGDLVGYAGGINAKRKLLQMELKNIESQQLDLFR